MRNIKPLSISRALEKQVKKAFKDKGIYFMMCPCSTLILLNHKSCTSCGVLNEYSQATESRNYEDLREVAEFIFERFKPEEKDKSVGTWI